MTTETATFASGCFRGIQKAFESFFKDDTIEIKVGYTGGDVTDFDYRQVCTGTISHAEAIQIKYTPNDIINYSNLVEFFYIMRELTSLDAQVPDVSTQYLSAIFYHSPEQEQIAKRVMDEVQNKHCQGQKICTLIVPANEWYDVEEYHQKYLENNPEGYACPTHFLRWCIVHI
ncbi:Peptide-methionine (S)-S-oxide reductase [Dissophora globulifera]|uniref:peptide-methionine (S)-S-oxide reductase n=1 Tax=Dissophora globulifera TaxID=979702 RepID=A0A9P6R9D1_9FUNG|nr:Peptide-methionine (S)-S-oxide reductase [Dissophora globulifera]